MSSLSLHQPIDAWGTANSTRSASPVPGVPAATPRHEKKENKVPGRPDASP
jgi:hypothetical protein